VSRLPVTPKPRGAHPRPLGRRLLGVPALALLLGVILASCGGSSQPPVAKLPQLHPGRVGPEAMFTPDGELLANPMGTLEVLKSLGVDRIHVDMAWNSIAPDPTSRTRPSFDASDPGAYPASGWAQYDAVIRDIKSLGMSLDLALWPPPPAWASGKGAPHPATQPEWRPSGPQFAQFVRAVGTRYSGSYVPPGSSSPLPRVNFWSIWNEPNLGIFLAPQAVPHSKIEISGMLYRQLVDAAWSGFAASGHGHDTILIGEIAPAGATFADAPGLFANMAPLRFLRALYCVDSSYRPLRGSAAGVRGCPTTAAGTASFAADNPGLFHATGFADHPYPQGLPPNEPTPGEPDYTELADLPKLEHALDTLQRVYGSNTKYPIWSTEFGYQTTPPDTEAGTVSPTRAAYYLNWSEYLTWLDPRVKSYDQYLVTDPPAGNFASGLESDTGVPKPGFFAYRMPIFLPVQTTRRGNPLEVWGCVRPAPDAAKQTGRRQKVAIQFQPASGGAFRTVATVPITDRYGYIDVRHTFPGSGTVRLRWAYPHGPEIFSRTVVISVR
jgi:hypothetical protein